jgi:hypothetical protein
VYLFGRHFVPSQHTADIVQATLGIVPLRRAFRMIPQRHRDLAFEPTEFAPGEPHQLAYWHYSHFFLHHFDRANRGLLVEARAPEEAGASLATGTKWRSASALAPIADERR